YFHSIIYLFFCFTQITRRTPRSTLFPYTTLFRSYARKVIRGSTLWLLPQAAIPLEQYPAIRLQRRYWQSDKQFWSPSHLILIQQDRKSTRLNSSHVKISYAVFCLKKKKKQDQYHI